jgi:pimeloyl-ACP methyl ester carboxylesterase
MEEGWDMFRIGPPVDHYTQDLPTHTGQQFPVEAFESFAAQWVPRWADHEELTLKAYEALIKKVGPCVVMAHSQGGGFALSMSTRCPEMFKAVIVIEPSGAPDQLPLAEDCPPYLMVWGDHVKGHSIWQKYRQRVDQHAQALRLQGAKVTQLDLTALGIAGNSHFPMLDSNSDQVLDQILNWLTTSIS